MSAGVHITINYKIIAVIDSKTENWERIYKRPYLFKQIWKNLVLQSFASS